MWNVKAKVIAVIVGDLKTCPNHSDNVRATYWAIMKSRN